MLLILLSSENHYTTSAALLLLMQSRPLNDCGGKSVWVRLEHMENDTKFHFHTQSERGNE